MLFYDDLADIFDQIKLPVYSLFNDDVTHTKQFRIVKRVSEIRVDMNVQPFKHESVSVQFQDPVRTVQKTPSS